MTDKREAILAKIDETRKQHLAEMHFSDNWMDRRDKSCDDEAIYLALRNQVEKHEPFQDNDAICSECGSRSNWVPYPCPTINEVASDLGLKDE